MFNSKLYVWTKEKRVEKAKKKINCTMNEPHIFITFFIYVTRVNLMTRTDLVKRGRNS